MVVSWWIVFFLRSDKARGAKIYVNYDTYTIYYDTNRI